MTLMLPKQSILNYTILFTKSFEKVWSVCIFINIRMSPACDKPLTDRSFLYIMEHVVDISWWEVILLCRKTNSKQICQ